MASKWRLTKAEEKQLAAEGQQMFEDKKAEGLTDEQASEARDQHVASRTHDIKQGKADKSKMNKVKGQSSQVAKASTISPEVIQNNQDRVFVGSAVTC